MRKFSKKTMLIAIVAVLALIALVSCDLAPEAENNDNNHNNNNNNINNSVCEHSYGEWNQDANIPVCSTGYQTRSCKKCGAEEQAIVPPVEHSLVAGVIESAEGDNIVARFCCEYCNMLLCKTLVVTDDEDGDQLNNATEIALGTDPFAADSDKDTISDYREVNSTNTNPLKADSDDDLISDIDELEVYGTHPLVADSDKDGVLDGKEIELNYDPLSFDESFCVTYTPSFAEGEDTTVVPSINNATLTPEQINSLSIRRDNSVSKKSLGYIGDAFEFVVDEDSIPEDAEISLEVGFEFDESTLNSASLPTIYAIEENEYGIKQMVPVETVVNGNNATALVDKFTTYVLVDRAVLESDLTWIDTYTIDRNFDKLEIVFVIDDSGSMGPQGANNDPNNMRLQVSRELINNLPHGTKIGIVGFADSYSDYEVFTQGLTSDKDVAMSYLTTDYFHSDGNSTDMYDAISRSFSLFESYDENTMRMLVVLTDGIAHDTSLSSSVISNAQSYGINIYSIGLGSSSSSYFYEYLEPMSTSTSGEFFYVDDASNLADAFEAIGEKINLTTDGDHDGLSDYYEENTNIFSGVNYNLNKDDDDTDDDGLLDGEEIITTIIYSPDGTQMTVTGVVKSIPSDVDSDDDGILDLYDPEPMIPAA